MNSALVFLVALTLGIALGAAGARRRLTARITRNLTEFLGATGTSLRDSDEQVVTTERLVHIALMEHHEPKKNRLLVIYSVSFAVAAAITVVVLLLARS